MKNTENEKFKLGNSLSYETWTCFSKNTYVNGWINIVEINFGVRHLVLHFCVADQKILAQPSQPIRSSPKIIRLIFARLSYMQLLQDVIAQTI